MQRLILAEKRVATSQCCAVFPWMEFCNSIPPKADETEGSRRSPYLTRKRHSGDRILRDQMCRIPVFRASARCTWRGINPLSGQLHLRHWRRAVKLRYGFDEKKTADSDNEYADKDGGPLGKRQLVHWPLDPMCPTGTAVAPNYCKSAMIPT